MDIPRQGVARKKLIGRIAVIGAITLAIPLITWGLWRVKPAAPSVEWGTIWPDTVKRGPMLRNVRGIGTLVPEEILWIPAANEGRVEQIIVRPGTEVKPDTLILVLSNPELEVEAADAEWQVKAAEANYTDLRVRLETQKLDLASAAAKVQSEFVQAKLKADLEEKLSKEGLTSELNLKLTRSTADELGNRYQIETKRVEISGESMDAQLAAQKVQIEKLRAAYELKKKQVNQLKVRAGTEGVLQELPVQVGQRLTPGTVLAKVAQPSKLKAEIKIAETQAKDVKIGQVAEIDTRNGVIPGHVVRIDPAVLNGTVTVDVKLEGALPAGARPDLSVDGTIELERLSDVLFMGRPVFGQPNSTITIFKVDPATREAHKVKVRLGRAAVNTIEILDGLNVGDQVVLSDMSAWDSYDRIRFN